MVEKSKKELREEKKEHKRQQDAVSGELTAAIMAQDEKTVKELLTGDRHQYLDLDNGVHLHAAVENGTPGMVEALLAAGADPRVTYGKISGYYIHMHVTPLRTAIKLEKIEMAKALLKDPRTEDPDYEPHISELAGSPSYIGPTARQLLKEFNRAAAWHELMDLTDARRFMEKFRRSKEILEKAGEWTDEDAPVSKKPSRRTGLNL